ncbi:Guanylate kinase [Candidatus Kinetoplastibacterium sorsogonicusi]|uniref:Guanylate kinase n=1 Tax=Candidatus Kinetoplastidibacterium kentomonadis TaxID=1576550 RepID=A0A3Q8ETL9_9PROT|nr:guanylate kinase [Candidatus Kinetoplastibacterium sorsogonicusi]AWD32388.1 Guanylate kinase [Candidatus Kinetoplastibacterium sorsogonicusi]
MNIENNSIFILVAPSGAGKSSLAKALIKKYNSIFLSISVTTRNKRLNEIDGVDYQYVSLETFENMKKNKMLLEWENVHGNMYGTPLQPIISALNNCQDVLLEIDYKGAKKIKKIFPNLITIFILPPSLYELKRRLQNRAQDDNDTIKKRLQNASKEIKYTRECEYVIINDIFNDALTDIEQIIRTEKLKFRVQSKKYFNLFKELGIFDI